MNRLTLDRAALAHNFGVIRGWIQERGASLTLVTKALCGHEAAVSAMSALGVTSMGDSRPENLRTVRHCAPHTETWYLRPPHRSAAADIVDLADVSLNSELEVLRVLDEEARKLGKIHRAVIMVELGDLREGVLPQSLEKMYREVFALSNINVVGIGANLGCLSGAVPNVDQLAQIALYRELLQLKFQRPLPLLSAGTSAVLPLLLEGRLPRPVNHFRIGESVLLGTDLVNGGTLPGLRDNAAILEAEVIEIKEKSLVPQGEPGDVAPFESLGNGGDPPSPGRRGYRALVAVGQLDTDVGSLIPVNPEYRLAGASSDITVVNLGEEDDGVKVGDTLAFRMGYSAFVRLMGNRYTQKRLTGPLTPEEKVSHQEARL